MAACGSLQRMIFEPENPPPSTFVQSLSSSSWTPITTGLHFKEDDTPNSKPDTEENTSDSHEKWSYSFQNGYHRRSESMSSESLQLCTESLGFESLDDIEDLKIESLDENNDINRCRMREKVNISEQCRKGKNDIGKTFPPPISCIRTTGKPWIFLESYRENGRLLLKEVRIPTQELLHACREDGRLRLCFIHPADEDDEDVFDDHDDDGDEGEDSEGEEGKDETEIRTDFERGNS